MTDHFSIRTALPCDKPAVNLLLQTGFGDEEWFLCAFFEHIWQRYDVLLSCEGERTAAMAALFPCQVCDQQGVRTNALYLYALSTHPEMRGRGHARRLLREAAGRCERVFLHAADQELHTMYARLGWQDAMYAHFRPLPQGDVSLPPRVDGHAYCAMREEWLYGTPHIVWNENLCCFAEKLLVNEGGGLYADSRCALAVQSAQDGCITLCEALGDAALPHAQALTPCTTHDDGAFPLSQHTGAALPSPLHLGFDFA